MNSVVVSKFLLSIASRVRSDSEKLSHIHTMLWGMVEFWNVIDAVKPRFILTDSETTHLEVCRQAMLGSYYWIHSTCAARSEAKCNLIPKYHQVDELVRRAIRTQVSPHLWWTFSSEDAMGTWARLASKCHGASTMRTAVDKWLLCFWAHHFAP